MLWILICFCVLSIDTDVVQGRLTKHNHGITVHKILSTWDEANDHCRREGGLLASPVDGKILDAMKSLMSVDKMYHIGIRVGHSPDTYLSLEGVPLENMTEAMDNMIQELDPLDGDCMAMDQKSIRFVSCWTRLQHLCYNTSLSDQHSHNRSYYANMNCSTEDCCGDKDYKYQLSSHKCYKIGNHLTWDEAFDACTIEGGQLAVLENENDKQNILNMNVLNHDYLYIGLRDQTGNGDWKSVDGRRVEDLLFLWNGGFSNLVTHQTSCAAISSTGELLWSPCAQICAFICEKIIRV